MFLNYVTSLIYMKKVLMSKSDKFLVKDVNKDFHTKHGFFKKEDLKKNNKKISSNTKKEFTIFNPSFIDLYRKIKRDAQIIPLKDIGLIISETGINKNSKVVDAGAGSGALCCFLASIVKEVTSYEIRQDFIEIVKKNIGYLELSNIKLKKKNIYEGDIFLIGKNGRKITTIYSYWESFTFSSRSSK